MKTPFLAAALLLGAAGASAQTLKPELAGIGFLVGDWTGGEGKVAETGGTSSGRSTITPEAGGAVLLRRDHTDLRDAAGKPAGGFDQVMTIYGEGGALKADYFDGSHVIHYASATVQPGKSVTFLTAPAPGAPSFRLSYTLGAPDTLTIDFAVAPPGSTTFNPIASGSVHKVR